MPVLRVAASRDDQQGAVDFYLLALRRVRRDLESGTGERHVDRPGAPMVASAPAASELIAELRHLIDALDRRVPHLERSGEADIARDAAALREEALARIAVLEKSL